MAASGDQHSWPGDAGPPCAVVFLSAQQLRLCSTSLDEWTVFAQGSWLSMPHPHPGFLAMVAVTSPLFWAVAGVSLPPGDCPTPDLQPLPSPESHNVVRSLPDLTGTGKAALGPRGKAKFPGRHTAAYEGLRGGGAPPPKSLGISFRWHLETTKRGRSGRVVWGLTTSCPQSKGVAGHSLTNKGDTAQEGGMWPGQLQDPHGPGPAHPLDPGWL